MNCLYYKEKYTERTGVQTGVMATATMQTLMCPRMGQPKIRTQTHSLIRTHAWCT